MKQMDLLDQQNSAPKPVKELENDPEFEQEFEEEESEEPHVFSVSEVNSHIRQMLEGEFPLLWIQGEISNFKAHTSGHFYFSLKDKKSQINAVMFKGFNSRLKFRPQTGQEVLIRGKVTVYEPRGNYQIFCEVMEPVGAGALQMAFEQLKKKLQKEGLFEQSRKRPLPQLPKHIALVTSPTGAAVKDMLNVLARRFKGAAITVVPVLVQGERAAPSIVEGLEKANAMKDVDVIICGRGGGSMEDLWAFNEEIVARAIVGSRVPVVSAVGHEVDFTIADFVADLRAPTPSAAAELVVKNAQELIGQVESFRERLLQAMRVKFQQSHQSVNNLKSRLVDPARRLQDLMQRCDELRMRLEDSTLRHLQDLRNQLNYLRQGLGSPDQRIAQIKQQLVYLRQNLVQQTNRKLENSQRKLEQLTSLMDSLSPLKVLDRGYAIVKKGDSVVSESAQLKKKDEINIRLAKGKLKAEIVEVEK